MIDVHCHLEQKELHGKLNSLIPKWKQEMQFVISSCAHVQDLDKTLEIYRKFKPFVRISIGLHPEFIKDMEEQQIEHAVKFIHTHIKDIVAIGEVGLDYHWVKEPLLREKQKSLFVRFIKLARELNLPIIIHSWNAEQDAIAILECNNMEGKKVLFHLLQEKKAIPKIIKNKWFVSIGPSILKSKDVKKIARDLPLSQIMLETDSPWFKQEGQEYGIPLNVKVALKKIAEIKKVSAEYVEKQTDKNAKEFFRL